MTYLNIIYTDYIMIFVKQYITKKTVSEVAAGTAQGTPGHTKQGTLRAAGTTGQVQQKNRKPAYLNMVYAAYHTLI